MAARKRNTSSPGAQGRTVWKAMRTKKRFTVKQAAKATGMSETRARTGIDWLRRYGYVQPMGESYTPSRGSFRVNPDKPPPASWKFKGPVLPKEHPGAGFRHYGEVARPKKKVKRKPRGRTVLQSRKAGHQTVGYIDGEGSFIAASEIEEIDPGEPNPKRKHARGGLKRRAPRKDRGGQKIRIPVARGVKDIKFSDVGGIYDHRDRPYYPDFNSYAFLPVRVKSKSAKGNHPVFIEIMPVWKGGSMDAPIDRAASKYEKISQRGFKSPNDVRWEYTISDYRMLDKGKDPGIYHSVTRSKPFATQKEGLEDAVQMARAIFFDWETGTVQSREFFGGYEVDRMFPMDRSVFDQWKKLNRRVRRPRSATNPKKKNPKKNARSNLRRGTIIDGWVVQDWAWGPPSHRNGPNATIHDPSGRWMLLVQQGCAYLRPAADIPLKLGRGKPGEWKKAWHKKKVTGGLADMVKQGIAWAKVKVKSLPTPEYTHAEGMRIVRADAITGGASRTAPDIGADWDSPGRARRLSPAAVRSMMKRKKSNPPKKYKGHTYEVGISSGGDETQKSWVYWIDNEPEDGVEVDAPFDPGPRGRQHAESMAKVEINFMEENPKKRKATKKKVTRKKTPPYQLLINRCQKLWTHYCERPSKKRLEAVYVHLDKMKASTSQKVKTERSRCLRGANVEAKKLKYKRK